MPRPLIGVCAAVEKADFGVWRDEPAVLLPLSYARAIHGAGGMMAMLPPDRRATEDPAELLEPSRRACPGRRRRHRPGEPGCRGSPGDHRDQSRPRPLRDRAGAGGARARDPAARRLPRDADPQRRLRRDARSAPARPARPRAPPAGARVHGPSMRCASSRIPWRRGPRAPSGSPSRAITIRESTRSRRTSTASAWATDDDSVEAIELTDGEFVLGVLWHPEEDPEDSVIRSLVSRATA